MTHIQSPRALPAHHARAGRAALHNTSGFIIRIMATFFIIGALLMIPAMAFAQQSQSPNAGPVDGSVPGFSSGTTSDSDLWRALKSGEAATISIKDKKAAVAIQTQGMDWLHLRNESISTYSAWGILGTIGLLALFFAVRGRIRIGHGGPSGEKIARFKLIERLGHWLLASSFIILAITGLNLVYGRALIIPLLGKDAFSFIAYYGKLGHNYVAFAFMVALVWVALTWIWYNIPHPRDLIWFARGGGILGGAHPPAKKFNAGQKIIFWVVILGGFSLSLSGWALLFPFTTHHFSDTFTLLNSVFGTSLPTSLTALQEQQLAQSWHSIMSVIMVCIIIAHIYIGSVGMEGAFAAMGSGEVDRQWANDHHSLWVEEEDAKARGAAHAGAGSAQPAE